MHKYIRDMLINDPVQHVPETGLNFFCSEGAQRKPQSVILSH